MIRFATTFVVAVLLTAMPGCDLTIESRQNLARARTLRDSGETRSAIQAYKQVISELDGHYLLREERLDITYEFGIFLNAEAKKWQPEYVQPAKEQFDAILAAPRSTRRDRLRAARAHSALGNTYHQEGEFLLGKRDAVLAAWEAARAEYEEAATQLRALEDWKNLAYTCYNLAQLERDSGDLEAAKDWISRAIELDREHGLLELEEDQAFLGTLTRGFPGMEPRDPQTWKPLVGETGRVIRHAESADNPVAPLARESRR